MRKAGILLPVFSVPSKYGIGDFGEGAYRFLDFLSGSGQSYWQVLPLGPTSVGDSPYQSPSSFGGNPYFISPDILRKDGLLKEDELREIKSGERIDYAYLYNTRFHILKTAFERFDTKESAYQEFCEENKDWLVDHSLFFAIKKHFNNIPFNMWNDGIKHRISSDMSHYRDEFRNEIEFRNFIQFEFYSQWKALKKYANDKGIKIIGDMPIYVSYDSVDVWKNPSLFKLCDHLLPTKVAGCPPDSFSEDGQLWGNPLYDWDAHEKDGYTWWINRLKYAFSMFDSVRIDHFRGFDEYYAIDYGEETAKNGTWEKGPGMKLFDALKKNTDEDNIIAEDLGFITPSVKKLLSDTGYAGIKVLQFAFDSRDSGNGNDYLPHNYPRNCIAYTGTHDNQTLRSWIDTITGKELQNVRNYLCDFYTPKEKLNLPLIASIMKSSSRICIIPLQDYMGLSDDARINTPGAAFGNWNYRLSWEDLGEELCDTIRKIAKLYDRV